MESGIYRIRNVVNEKMYIGQSINVENRLKHHLKELQSGSHINYFLQIDFDKYKEESFIFEKIHECEEEFLNVMEKYFIEKYNTTHNGYNIKNGNSTLNNKYKAKLEKENEMKQLRKELENLSIMDMEIDEITYTEFKLCVEMQDLFNKYLTDDETKEINSTKLSEKVYDKLYIYESYFQDNICYYVEPKIGAKAVEKLKKYTDVLPEISIDDEVVLINFIPTLSLLSQFETSLFITFNFNIRL